ncbi:unnamed protein product [Rodentolepis nana]|uniref:long-chain-fatty-acid--CoA ligase n=1 Tax=Rodentolepis nana TaxID=102285 RepID=A0A158QGX4_RODNA|nr:unnamed protein product [Rodentolepis nana]
MSKNDVNSYKPSIQNYSYTLEDGSHVNPSYKDLVLPNILRNGSKCVHDLFKEAMTLGGDRDFLGTHPTPSSPYVWKSFREVYELVKQFGSGLRTIDSLTSEPFKCCAELSVLVCDSSEKAMHLLSLAEQVPFVKHIVIMNNDDDLVELKTKAGDNIEIVTFNDILERGKSSPLETMPSEPDDLALVCYTSGTTGVPKGVVISNRMMLASLNNNILNCGQGIITSEGAYLSYLPMAHILEQMFVLLTIFSRGRIGFYSGEPRLLFEDAKMLKPTLWTTVPRILLRIYEGVQKKIGNSSFKKSLFNRALGAKIKSVDAHNFSTNTIWDILFFSKVRALMGGNVRVIVCGGAPLPTHVLRFTRAAFSCWVFEGYGSTETAGSLSSAAASDCDGGHVGAPVPGLRVKLADIPSMNIVAARDNKGEIRVKGPSCTTGYYKDPENTAELFDSEGWMRTGDVAVWTDKNSLKIVDRCKHIFKLSQGEYVAPEKIESVYLESRFVNQVFVDGDTEQSYPVAIVVPEAQTLAQYVNSSKPDTTTPTSNGISKNHQPQQKEAPAGDSVTSVKAPGEQSKDESVTATEDKKSAVQAVTPDETYVVHGSQMTLEQLCDYKPAIKTVLDDLYALGKARGLKGFEQVKAIRLSSIPFTIENGMLTPTLKSARTIIRQEFASAIKALYHPTSI